MRAQAAEHACFCPDTLTQTSIMVAPHEVLIVFLIQCRFDIADRLRERGWVVPACELSPHACPCMCICVQREYSQFSADYAVLGLGSSSALLLAL